MCLEEMGMSGELLLTNGVGGQWELASRPSCRTNMGDSGVNSAVSG